MTTESSVSAEIWRDPAAAPASRVSDLSSRMTMREKIAQLYGVWVGIDAAGGDVVPHQHEFATAPADLDKLMDAVAGTDDGSAAAAAHQGEHLYTSERVVVSPAPGVFEPDVNLAALESTALAEATAAPGSGQGAEPGSLVAVGDRVGTVGPTEVRTPFDGILVRWLAVRGERVVEGQPVAWIRTGGNS